MPSPVDPAAQAWGQVGAMLQRRALTQPSNAEAKKLVERHGQIPLDADGKPDAAHPAYALFRRLHVTQHNALASAAPTPAGEAGGTVAATEDEVRLWLRDLSLLVRDPDHEARRYFLRLPVAGEPALNEAGMSTALASRLYITPKIPWPFVQALTAGDPKEDRLHVLLVGPKQTYGHDVRLWLQCEALGQSFLWPGNQALWLALKWHALNAEAFAAQALPWTLPKAKPLVWKLRAVVGQYVMPLAATVEVFPRAKWEADFALHTAPNEGSRPLDRVAPPLVSDAALQPTAWHVTGKVDCTGRDLTVESARLVLSKLSFLDVLAGLPDFLRAVAAKARGADLPAAATHLDIRFSGTPFPQEENGLIAARWQFDASAKPVFCIEHEVDFLPWLAAAKRKGRFLQRGLVHAQAHQTKDKLQVRLETRGKFDLDWKFQGESPGLPRAEGQAQGLIDLTVWGGSNQDYEAVVIFSSAADNPSDGPGAKCHLLADVEPVEPPAFGPAVCGQFRWGGLAIHGGAMARGGVVTGDLAGLLGEIDPETTDVISAPQLWPEAAGVSQLIFA